jgi:hypothetical protein
MISRKIAKKFSTGITNMISKHSPGLSLLRKCNMTGIDNVISKHRELFLSEMAAGNINMISEHQDFKYC